MTRKLFSTRNHPRVVNMKDFKAGADASAVVCVMRPTLLGNPFRIGDYLTISQLKSALSTVSCYPNDNEKDAEWVSRELPYTYGVMVRLRSLSAPIGREEAVSCYGEWLRVAAARDPQIKDLILSLEGKMLGCCCKPKRCHADEIVKVFGELKGGH